MNGSSHLTNGIGNGHIHKNGNGAPAAKKMKICPKEELAEFDKVFKILMDECLNEGEARGSKEIGDAMTHFLNVCELLFQSFLITPQEVSNCCVESVNITQILNHSPARVPAYLEHDQLTLAHKIKCGCKKNPHLVPALGCSKP